MTENYKIREVIVVEGKSDVIAVKRAFKGNITVVATHGLGLDSKLLDELAIINENKGIIVLTDPDYAGKKIAAKIRDRIPNAKFANIARSKAYKKDNIGVENASDSAIIEAINMARPELEEAQDIFTLDDIMRNGLSGLSDSKDRRIKLCEKLGLTYSNAKQLLVRLNSFGISREEFEKAIIEIEEK